MTGSLRIPAGASQGTMRLEVAAKATFPFLLQCERFSPQVSQCHGYAPDSHLFLARETSQRK